MGALPKPQPGGPTGAGASGRYRRAAAGFSSPDALPRAWQARAVRIVSRRGRWLLGSSWRGHSWRGDRITARLKIHTATRLKIHAIAPHSRAYVTRIAPGIPVGQGEIMVELLAHAIGHGQWPCLRARAAGSGAAYPSEVTVPLGSQGSGVR